MAFLGTGIASGENRALDAAQKAISSPLLVDTSIEGARGVLINITGGKDMTLHEVSKASELIHRLAHPEANIIFGTVIDASMKDMVKVTVIATGFDKQKIKNIIPNKDSSIYAQKTPPAFPVERDTPPYAFEPQGNKQIWEPPAWEAKWDPYQTPSFMRKNRHAQFRKSPHDNS
jgi:cell division protein FtsZ